MTEFVHHLDTDTTELPNAPCSRCGKTGDLIAYHLAPVTYRGRAIPEPWLCRNCLRIEKDKAWRAVKA